MEAVWAELGWATGQDQLPLCCCVHPEALRHPRILNSNLAFQIIRKIYLLWWGDRKYLIEQFIGLSITYIFRHMVCGPPLVL